VSQVKRHTPCIIGILISTAMLGVISLLAAALCPIGPNTSVVIYHGNGATSECRQWESDFYAWLGLEAVGITAAQLHDTSCGGRMKDLGVQIFAVPGGNAYDLQTSSGTMGKKHILAFIDANGTYVGTCAGAYFASSGYYWQMGETGGGHFNWPYLLGRFPEVEGSITSIQDDAVPPGYKLTGVTTASAVEAEGAEATVSLHAIYWGGPTRGFKSLPKTGTPGTVLATFSSVSGSLPAAWHVRDRQGTRLLFSAHFEAEEGIGIQGTGLTPEQTLANWQYRARMISDAASLSVAIPSARAPPSEEALAAWKGYTPAASAHQAAPL